MATTHAAGKHSLGEATPASDFTTRPVQSSAGAHDIEEIFPSIYEELRRLAAAYLRGERVEHTLQSTALVHEAYLRLLAQPHVEWQNPAHLIGIFARIMRQTLTNYAVAKNRLKRGGPEKVQKTLEFY